MNPNNSELLKAITDFPQQFTWQPTVYNPEFLPVNPKNIAICGMGGSALAANLLLTQTDIPNIRIHRDYWHDWLCDMDLIIISSFSGNTEEMLDVLDNAIKHNIPVAISSNGGEVIKRAVDENLSYVKLPDALQPRYAIGYSYIALAKLCNVELNCKTAESLATIACESSTFNEIASELSGKQIVYYSTAQNFSIAYVWKILTNESGKQMAWANKIPEFNHNELNGYATSKDFNLAENLAVVFFVSDDDHPRNKKRVEILSDQIQKQGITVVEIDLGDMNLLERAVFGWQAGMITTLELAKLNEVDPTEVKMIEDLKNSLRG